MEQANAKDRSPDRSPNYPGLSLEAALDAVRKLHKEDGTAPVPQETLAKFAGHGKMSGPARSKIAGIRQYGLIEGAGAGKVRVSDRALPLFFHQPSDREYQQTLKDLALAPALFSQLFTQYAQASEATIRLHLVRDRKFSEEGAKRLASIFKDTIAFAKLGTTSYNSPGSEADHEDKDSHGGDQDLPAVSQEPLRRTGSNVLPTVDASALSLDYLLGGIPAKLSFARQPSARAIQRLIAYLQLLKEDIEEAESEGGD
jgi:hypothetical protein